MSCWRSRRWHRRWWTAASSSATSTGRTDGWTRTAPAERKCAHLWAVSTDWPIRGHSQETVLRAFSNLRSLVRLNRTLVGHSSRTHEPKQQAETLYRKWSQSQTDSGVDPILIWSDYYQLLDIWSSGPSSCVYFVSPTSDTSNQWEERALSPDFYWCTLVRTKEGPKDPDQRKLQVWKGPKGLCAALTLFIPLL